MDKNIDKNIEDKDNKFLCSTFQEQVDNVLIRHKSILDVMTKLDEYNSRINRAVAKSVTSCGCITINATRQNYNEESFEKIIDSVKSHVEGELCPGCKEVIDKEIGSYIFYLAALCNTLNLSLDDILSKEYDIIKTLGLYSLK